MKVSKGKSKRGRGVKEIRRRRTAASVMMAQVYAELKDYSLEEIAALCAKYKRSQAKRK